MLQAIGEFEGATLLYTAPAKTDDLRTEEQFRAFRTLLEPYRSRPWIWIFDGGGMTARHYANMTFCKQMYKILDTEHKQSLQGVWILNLNTWLRSVIQIFPASKPVTWLPAERLELFVTMQRKGVSSRIVDILLAALNPSS